jgi:hypothetical protein
MPEVHDPLLEVLDEAPEDEEVPTAREEQGANQAVAEYRRGDAREPDAVVQPGPHGWRILVTPEARRDLEQRDIDIRSVEAAIRARDPKLSHRISRATKASARPDATRSEIERIHRLIDDPERFRPLRLSRFPRYTVTLLRRCPAHPDQWIVGPGRSRIMVDRDAHTIVLLKVLRGTAARRSLLRRLLDLRLLPAFIRLIWTIRRTPRDGRR